MIAWTKALFVKILLITSICTVLIIPTVRSSDVNNILKSLDSVSLMNHTRCSQTRLSFSKETLLHIWDIRGLLGYIGYVKRFGQPFELQTEHISFKSENVDGKWSFKILKMSNPNNSQTTETNNDARADINDLKIVATYSYEAKQTRKIDFLIRLSLIHGKKEVNLSPQKSTSPTIVQQRYYNNRGFQLNSNFLQYVYTFTWGDVIQSLDNFKSNAYSTKDRKHEKSANGPPNDQDASEEYFEAVTQSDFSGHSGDITMKFVISSYFPEEPISVTTSRCNSSILEHTAPNLSSKLGYPVKPTLGGGLGGGTPHFHKDNAHRFHAVPPYNRYSNSMLHDDRFVDVILVVGDDELPAHKIILATSSPIFSEILENATLLSSNQSTSSSCKSIHLTRITMEPLGVDCIAELLRYIYTGTVDNSKMSDGLFVNRLIVAADKYGLPELKRYCETILLMSLNEDNAVELYKLGSRVSSNRLIRKASHVIKLNKTSISQTEV